MSGLQGSKKWICRQCLRTSQLEVELEPDPNNWDMACPVCFLVDPNATSFHTSRDESIHTGAIMEDDIVQDIDLDEHHDSKTVGWRVRVNILIREYSELLKCQDINFVRGAHRWYEQIRAWERKVKGQKRDAIECEARRLPYQCALAIRMAICEANAVALHIKIPHKPQPSNHVIMNLTKGDDSVPIPTLSEIFTLSQTLPTGHRCGNLQILSRTHRNLSAALKNRMSSMDITLCMVNNIIKYIRDLMSKPLEERLEILQTGQNGWTEENFSFFSRVSNWDEVLHVAYGLYQAQQCVSLWSSKESPLTAIALALWAFCAVIGDTPKQGVKWEQELSALYGNQANATSQRFVEMKMFLCAWSSSIEDAGLTLPRMKPPTLNGVQKMIGDGLNYWAGDKRRSIPPNVVAATSAKLISQHWREILSARCRTRNGPLIYDIELNVARKLYGKAAPKPDIVQPLKAQRPVAATPRRADSAAISSANQSTSLIIKSSPLLDPSKTWEECTIVTSPRFRTRPSVSAPTDAQTSSVPLSSHTWEESSITSSPRLPSRLLQSTSAVTASTSTLSSSVISRSSASTSHNSDTWEGGSSTTSPRLRLPLRLLSEFAEDNVEELLANVDDSSDEESGMESDDENRSHDSARARHGLGLSLGSSEAPFSFTIGPEGFSVNKSGSPSRKALPPVQRESSSEASSCLMIRRGSSQSESSLFSLSSANGSERHTSLFQREHYSKATRARFLRRQNFIPATMTTPLSPAATSIATSRSPSIPPPPHLRIPPVASAPTMLHISTSQSDSNSAPSSSPRSPAPAQPEVAGTALESIHSDPASKATPVPYNREEDHVGVLVREKAQYVISSLAAERLAGRIVGELVENFLKEWVKVKKKDGSIPEKISPEYLTGLGLCSDFRTADLNDFTERRAVQWSPLECYLRVGVEPVKLPETIFPRSVCEAKAQLYLWPDRSIYEATLTEDDEERDREILFTDSESFNEIILTSKKDLIQRAQQYAHIEDDWFQYAPENGQMSASWERKHRKEQATLMAATALGEDSEEMADEVNSIVNTVPEAEGEIGGNRDTSLRNDFERVDGSTSMLEAIARRFGDGEGGADEDDLFTDAAIFAAMRSRFNLAVRPCEGDKNKNKRKADALMPSLWDDDGMEGVINFTCDGVEDDNDDFHSLGSAAMAKKSRQAAPKSGQGKLKQPESRRDLEESPAKKSKKSSPTIKPKARQPARKASVALARKATTNGPLSRDTPDPSQPTSLSSQATSGAVPVSSGLPPEIDSTEKHDSIVSATSQVPSSVSALPPRVLTTNPGQTMAGTPSRPQGASGLAVVRPVSKAIKRKIQIPSPSTAPPGSRSVSNPALPRAAGLPPRIVSSMSVDESMTGSNYEYPRYSGLPPTIIDTSLQSGGQ